MGVVRADARWLPIASGVVHCCVTSPPYFGLRDYGTAVWVGGDERCTHLNGPLASPKSTLGGYSSSTVKLARGGMPCRGVCGSCGAVRQDAQLGLEPTPDAYVASLVAVMREVGRVLRDDGTCWLNLGDSYAGGAGRWGGYDNLPECKQSTNHGSHGQVSILPAGVKPKDLLMMPARVALALQADGWYLRSDIIWAKPNPMPESVTDRPTKSHEHVFLLTKAARYYYDAKAIAEDSICLESLNGRRARNDDKARMADRERFATRGFAAIPDGKVYATRNKRDVWTINSQCYSGSHFATMPEALVTPCILAGCPPGGLVLDPFLGSGTVGAVASRLGRRWVGTDLNYQQLSSERTAQRGLMFAAV